MQGYLSDAVALDWMTSLSTRAAYASLHFELPNWTNPHASELPDASYARAPISWNVLSNRSIGNKAKCEYVVALGTTIAAVGFWTSTTAGTMVAYATPPPGLALTVPAIGRFVLGVGEIVLGFT